MASPGKNKRQPAKLTEKSIASFFREGQSVLIGLSGGADSVTLLHLMARLSERIHLNLSVCHINHHLRGDESDSDSAFCDELCEQLEIPFIQVDIEIAELARRRKVGLEEAGRLARYAIFEEIARQDEIDLIALGHHADDQVETILFRLFRGTGPDGLSGIPARRGRIVRPLLEFSRAQILDFLLDNKLDHRVDSSNLDETFTRNYIRSAILPEIESRFPAARGAMLRLANIQSEESAHLDQQTEKLMPRVVRFSPGGTAIIDCARFNREPGWLKRRLVRKALESVGGELQDTDYETVERLVELSSREKGGLSLTGPLRAKVERGQMFLSQGGGVRLETRAVCPGQRTPLPEISSYVRTREVAAESARLTRQPNGLTVYLNPLALKGGLTVRSVARGDRFGPLGMKGSKPLGDFFTDHKVPTSLRGEVALLSDQIGIIWVAGYEIADRVKLNKEGQTGALEVKVVREKRRRS
ncbi:MAG: tRNA lysidine(34) synthetase TilS [Candidatus Zixiibacteriota bacterium]